MRLPEKLGFKLISDPATADDPTARQFYRLGEELSMLEVFGDWWTHSEKEHAARKPVRIRNLTEAVAYFSDTRFYEVVKSNSRKTKINDLYN